MWAFSKVVLFFGALLWAGSLVAAPWTQGPDRPDLPPLPDLQTLPNFTGDYRLLYTDLTGSLEACLAVGPRAICAPVALAIPLDEDGVRVEDLATVQVSLAAALAERFPGLSEETWARYDALMAGLLPLLVEDLNDMLAGLPDTMSLFERVGSPHLKATLELSGKPTTLPGSVRLSNGDFRLGGGFIQGNIDATHLYVGQATMRCPTRLEEAAQLDPSVPHSPTLTLSLSGELNAGLEARQH